MAPHAEEAKPATPSAPSKQNVAYPLSPLTASEIAKTAELIRSLWPDKTDLRFKAITLDEPAKKEFVSYLDAQHSDSPLPFIARKAFVAYYIRNTVRSIH